ncbi:alpha/beta hydrolase [Pelagicoccus sp. SDUM812003]|uniref:alpha/beta hydrolase n=1 Tax=Pelagicoccus sp. SDUM812003 TaxID=3041267 RepID=UPI00280FB856|nr:alpha/beta hydrolase [Pelagicoccus sp. SDUM812003]MDQ8204455.1 alpha/beta hydrolase [Pelagicoccus sp. SDUM812003]
MREREQRNPLNGLLVLIAVSVLFFYLFAHQITNKALFQPRPTSYELSETDDSIRLIEAEDGTQLAVFWAPSPGARRTVFYFHGNAEDLGDIAFILNNYRLQGVNVLAYDYRDYGLSEGKPSEKLTYRDAETVLDYAVSALGVDPQSVVFHGRSLGGGIAMEMAVRRPAAGLILESTFLSAYRIYLPLKWMPGDKYVNASKAKKLSCPTLIIHGREDQVVPFAHGEELARLLPDGLGRTLWIEEAGHNDVATRKGATFWAGIRGFLMSLNESEK